MFLGNRGKREEERKGRRKSGEGEGEDKAWKQRRAGYTRANPVYLARNFQSQLSQEKELAAMKSCSAGSHLVQFKLPYAVRDLPVGRSISFPLFVFAIRMSDHSGFSLLSLVVKQFRTIVTSGDSHLEYPCALSLVDDSLFKCIRFPSFYCGSLSGEPKSHIVAVTS